MPVPALVLTEENAREAGYTGDGPFTFGGAFPGELIVGQPVELAHFGFANEDDAQAALDESGVPLELVDVEEGSGPPIRENHALSEDEVTSGAHDQAADETAAINTHAEADAAGKELGLTFAAKAKLSEKVAAIEQAREALFAEGDPNELTPAPGAEDTTPQLTEPERGADRDAEEPE